jgi:hypothetical protein
MLIEKHRRKGSLQPIVIDPFDMKAKFGRFVEAFCNDTGTEVRGCPGEKAKTGWALARSQSVHLCR